MVTVIKRNNTEVEFNKEKIVSAINKAAKETEVGIDDKLAHNVANKIEKKFKDSKSCTIEDIQDCVEEILMESKRRDIAKRYILYREKQNAVRKHGWEMTDLQRDILNNKYIYENEGFNGFIDRVGHGFPDIKKMMRDKRFLSAGRILMGRRLNLYGKKITYSNCFVITPPEDNIESIFDTAKKMARTYSYGGGCGTSLEKLRPRGAGVNNSAKETTGSVSFMDLYSMTTGLIGQQGRRGALMLSMPVTHPDIIEFVNVKTDLNRVTFANISIMVTDDFMEAVKHNQMWEMRFEVKDTGEVITRKTWAKDLFRLIAKNNWRMAEPGFLFWDRVTGYHINSEDPTFVYASTNPCFTGDMKLLTKDGYKTFKDLDGQIVDVISHDGQVSKGNVWSTGEKETVKVKFSNDDIITCTPNHVFMTVDGESVEAQNLKGKRPMRFINNEPVLNDELIKYGFIQGDGCLNRLVSNEHMGFEVNIGAKDKEILNLFLNDDYTHKNHRAIYLRGYKEKLQKLGFSIAKLPERIFPTTYDKWDKKDKASFLNGCYSANGSIIKGARIAYKTTCKQFAEQLKSTLATDFGINAYITINKSKPVTFSNGTYVCKESYDINIHQFEGVKLFYENIGFYHSYKKESLKELLLSKCPIVTSVALNKVETVYDFGEPINHWGVVEGVIAHNCGEKPLPSGGSCLLGSMNLDGYLRNGKFDFELFNSEVRKAVRYLDYVLGEGIELLPLEEQKESVSRYRQIGLGIMGMADMLIHMRVRYGSNESLLISDKIASNMINMALQESAMMAKEFGTYPAYNKEYVMKSPFLHEVAWSGTMELIEKYGLRNAELLSIAPTGSISTMIGVSGGIEPIFNISYTRESKTLSDEGSTFYKVFTPIAKEYMDENGITREEDLPDFFVTSATLNYKERVDMQSVWQKYIDAAISSTVNVPYEFTVEQVEDMYMYAWEKGLKGITLFRDGCERLGILTTESDKKPEADDKEVIVPVVKSNPHDKFICPECGGKMFNAGGCEECQDCGYSPCAI